MIVGITMQTQPSSAAHEECREGDDDDVAVKGVQQQPVQQLHLSPEQGTTGYPGAATHHDPHLATAAYEGQPPSQVYVNALGGQVGEMEQQFRQFGLRTDAAENNSNSENHNGAVTGDSSENTPEPNGSESEEDPVKLFVGQVRRQKKERKALPLAMLSLCGGRNLPRIYGSTGTVLMP